ncbi:MAG: hypothetical protein R3242_11990 [Akkermansiaceae bacterium]|nr:hypothetical protein [Akkermansiaceae bacterium]
MTSDPSSSSEGSKPLPKATVPVELAPPAEPAGIAPPKDQTAHPPKDQTAQEPAESETTATGAAPAKATEPAEEPASPTPQAKGFGAWLRSLSMVEKFCCAAIVVGVLVFAAAVFVPALYDFPEQPEMAESSDFPIAGAQVTVRSAETYWREPVREGENAEEVRADVVLVPVFDAKLEGQGEIRLLFRDSEGELVGDLLTLELAGGQDYTAVCSDGFKYRGNFTAYQAGELEPWTVEFHEVPEGTEEINAETELFKMKISPILKK